MLMLGRDVNHRVTVIKSTQMDWSGTQIGEIKNIKGIWPNCSVSWQEGI